MKKNRIKNEHYSTLKTIIRIGTLVVAIWALVISYQNKQSIEKMQYEQKWLQSVQDNIIEKLMFPGKTKTY